MKMKATIEISDEKIENLLVCAFEGGSNYWIDHTEIDPKCKFYEAPFESWLKVYTVDEPGRAWFLNRITLESGMSLMAQKHPRHFADVVSENEDANTGDIFLQLCLFEELVYG